MSTFLPILYALLAALFYAINVPLSKILLNDIPAVFTASFLYLGAGIGIGIIYLFHFKNERKEERLDRGDALATFGMIILDIVAPICLMYGIRYGSAANASLLENFEIVATSLIALVLFKEKISSRLWIAVGMITAASIILSFSSGGFSFSPGSLFVLLATVCWGLENNCTERISNKSTYQIVTLKGIFSGLGSFIIALIVGESLPELRYILYAMLLGFVAYGLSIFTYVRAQRSLGAAKTSAYYASAPFIGVFLSYLLIGEELTTRFFAAALIMLLGTVLVIWDTVGSRITHQHVVVHDHDGLKHRHVISHRHFMTGTHQHSLEELEPELTALHSS